MNNLTTRKIVLGLLMTLVLAFSVQGIADALTLHYESNSGDLTTVAPNQEFTIRVSVKNLIDNTSNPVNPGTSEGNTTDIEYASEGSTRSNVSISRTVDTGWTNGDTHYYTISAVDTTTVTGLAITTNTRNWGLSTETPLAGQTWTPGRAQDLRYASGGSTRSNVSVSRTIDTDYADGDTHYYTTSAEDTTTVAGLAITTNTRNWLTEDEAYYYNEEAVTIESDIMLEQGDTAVTSLIERHEESDQRLSNTITLTGSHGDAGAFNITITDNTGTGDIDGPPPSPRASIIYTIFVVDRDPSAVEREWGFTGLTSAPERYKVGGDDFTDDAITTASSTEFNRVEYSVIEGSGRLYVQRTPTRKTSSNRTITTSAAAVVHLDMNGTTNKVRASISGEAPVTATFIFGHPEVAIVSGNGQEGGFGGQLDDPLVVKVTDGRGRALSGLAADFDTDDTITTARFIPVPGTTVYTTTAAGSVLADSWNANTREATSTRPPAAVDIVVQTDSRGEARTYFQLATSGASQTVTVMAGGSSLIDPPNFRFDAESGERRPTLSILSGNNQTTDSDGEIEDPLVVVVRQDDRLKPNELVTFHTSKGTLIGRNEDDDDDLTNKRVYGMTDGRGRAEVEYFQDPGEGSDTVTATISGTDPAYEREIVFGINGGQGTRAPAPAPAPAPATNTITITLSETSGEPGDEIDVTISASPNTVVVIDSGDLDGDDFSREFGTTPFDTVISLPDEDDEYTFTAEATGYTSDSATVTVEAGILGRLAISRTGTPSGGSQSFSITAQDTDGEFIIGALTVRLSGSGFATRTVETSGGRGNARVTLPTAAGSYTLTVSADDYTSGSTQIRVAATGQQEVAEEEEEEETVTVSEPDSISIVGPSTRSGTVNEELGAALIVEVVDDDGEAVEDARVIFRVRSGQGRLSEAGSTVSGRAIRVLTDDDGHARANYTPTGGGTHTVKAEVKGVTRTVEFTITTGSAPADETGTRDAGTAPGSISPVVHVGAASRPPMLWVDGGAIYALVGADVQEFAPSVDNALNIAVGGGKVYWTEKTGDAGTINSANLNGSDVTELTSIKAVPMGIAVDTAGSKLYWTNSRGRIQSANLDGSGITNVIPGGLESPMDIALAGGNAYWTQGGNVRFVNLRGTKQIRNISTGTDAAGSLAIGGGKVYWTEMTGDSGGTINSANLNGTGATQLASIKAVPMGIAVDGSRSKLYWSNSRGRIQSANLDGSRIQSVVDGLGSPGELVLSNSIAAPAATPKTPKSTATASKYDVNGDGSVNNADSDAVTVAIAAGATDAKYDVNGDGTVNVFDLVEIIANRDPGAAGAPTLFGMKLSALQIDLIQEQIDLLIATNDRSPAAMRVLVYLQQLLVTARPEKTQLLANYPNPFNPETWIPYELATDTHVRLTIYNTQGVVIRSLQFGHQSAGYYTGRDRAAYWDGRNALGEQVASGLYFYQLETDEMSLMRKMVILK